MSFFHRSTSLEWMRKLLPSYIKFSVSFCPSFPHKTHFHGIFAIAVAVRSTYIHYTYCTMPLENILHVIEVTECKFMGILCRMLNGGSISRWYKQFDKWQSFCGSYKFSQPTIIIIHRQHTHTHTHLCAHISVRIHVSWNLNSKYVWFLTCKCIYLFPSKRENRATCWHSIESTFWLLLVHFGFIRVVVVVVFTFLLLCMRHFATLSICLVVSSTYFLWKLVGE